MSRRLDPFYSAKLPFSGLHSDIAKMKVRAETFVNRPNLVPFKERDTQTGELVVKVRVVHDVPDDIERDAITYLTELRGALDKAINGSARILGSRSLKHTNFPFGDSKDGFAGQLNSTARGHWRGIPGEIHKLLLDLMPYPTRDGVEGGDDLLALLGELSNPAKHESTLFVSLQVDGIYITKWSGGDIAFPQIGAIWNDSRDECEVMRIVPTSGQFEFVAPLQISFNSSGKFAERDFVSLFSDMAKKAESIVLKIEARTAEVVKERQ